MTFVNALTELGTNLSTIVVNIFAKIAEIFVTTSESGAMQVTVFGYLALLGLISGLISMALSKLFGMIRKR